MADPDFDALAAQATDILQRYIRVDTTNPPGNEELAADFLAEILKSEGIESHEADLGAGPSEPLRDASGLRQTRSRWCC